MEYLRPWEYLKDSLLQNIECLLFTLNNGIMGAGFRSWSSTYYENKKDSLLITIIVLSFNTGDNIEKGS